MSGSKTKEILVDVARKLFAEFGKNNITMHDIATVSKKGRRTLYTYFKSKNDIYFAVIENELTILLKKLQTVANKNIPPDEKLSEYIFVRQNAIKESVKRNGSLRSDFFKDIYEVQRARRRIDIIEQEIIKNILDSGVEQGVFDIEDTKMGSMLILYSLKGIETPYTRERISEYMDERRPQIIKALFEGIRKK
jgi:AcrR family transcriptional regulator